LFEFSLQTALNNMSVGGPAQKERFAIEKTSDLGNRIVTNCVVNYSMEVLSRWYVIAPFPNRYALGYRLAAASFGLLGGATRRRVTKPKCRVSRRWNRVGSIIFSTTTKFRTGEEHASTSSDVKTRAKNNSYMSYWARK
jgi:hypothetical protein